MAVAELVLKYIQALAWPLVTLGLAWVLRGQIRGAFARMTRLETPAGAIDFATEVRDVLVQADAAGVAGSGGPPGTVGWEGPHLSVGGSPYGEYGSADGDSVPQQQPAQPETQPRGGSAPPVPPPPSYGYPAPASYPSPRPVFGGLREARELVPLSPAQAVISAWSTLNDFCVDVLRQRSVSLRAPRRDTEVVDALKAAGVSPGGVTVFYRLASLSNRAKLDGDTVTARAALDFLDTCQKMADLVSEELVRAAY